MFNKACGKLKMAPRITRKTEKKKKTIKQTIKVFGEFRYGKMSFNGRRNEERDEIVFVECFGAT